MQVATAMMTFAFGASMNVPRIQFWAAAGAVFGAFLFVRGFQMLRAKRLILNTPESKIRSASMGLVEINGTASGPKTIPAGISGDPCYYYRAMAWQLRQSGNNREWMKVADECVYVPFFVEDSTGRVLVDPAGAELDIHRKDLDRARGVPNRIVSDSGQELSPAVKPGPATPVKTERIMDWAIWTDGKGVTEGALTESVSPGF